MIGEGYHHASLSRGGGDRTKLRPLTATDINKPEGFVFDLFESVIFYIFISLLPILRKICLLKQIFLFIQRCFCYTDDN